MPSCSSHPLAPSKLTLRPGDPSEGARLFSLAADKFDAALDLEPRDAQALRLGGQSLLDAGLCAGAGGDAREAKAAIKARCRLGCCRGSG